MITEIGKELRKLRIDHNERLLDMAKKMGKSAAFISSVETGKKAPPQGFEDEIIRLYEIPIGLAQRWQMLADRARRLFTLEPRSELGRDVSGLLARKMNILDDEKLEKIKAILIERRRND